MPNLQPMLSYLPRTVAERILRRPDRPLIGEGRRFEAAVIFADVSGFTPLTEALGALGTVGTEELTRALSDYFAPLVALVHEWGGIVGKFAGDAMTLLFPGEEGLERALACALAMQQVAEEHAAVATRAGHFTLRMKLGVAFGPVLEAVVGYERRAEYIFAGPPLDGAAEAEHHADAGTIVLHPSLCAAMREERVRTEALEGGYRRLHGLTRRPTAPPFEPLPPPVDAEAVIRRVRPFLPAPIYRLLLDGRELLVNEHRRVTILFVRFDGLDYTDPHVLHPLQRYAEGVARLVSDHGGYLARLDMGDKGSKAIILFGAPLAREDDEERALLCALAIRELGEQMEAIREQRIGINSGYVFAGNIGSRQRREYTVMGDAVNLAARLMQAAKPGQVLVGEATYRQASRRFRWEPLPPMRVKGKRAPVAAFALQDVLRGHPLRLQEPHYTLPMVGRQRELAEITARLQAVAREGKGETVAVIAEAGMGKSRLTAEVIGTALGMGFVGYGGEGVSHGTTTPYLAWRPLLRGLLDVAEGLPLEAQITALRRSLTAIDPDLTLRLPLLGEALGLPIPDNTATRHFDADLRRESLFALIARLIRARAAEHPLLLVMEDAHWLDDPSRDLLHHVAEVIADLPALLLVVHRPITLEGQPPLWREPPPRFHEIHLGPFTPEESRRLIRLKLAGRELPPRLVATIEERAQGNPFFVDEFVNLLLDRGVDLGDTEALEQLEVPDSLNTLIISRLDQLAESERMTLRIASVIGRLFRARWLLAIYPGEIEAARLKRDLDRLDRLGLTPRDREEPELEYLFKHALTRDVAYSTLSFAARRSLHRRFAAYLERHYADELRAWYAILAYHYRRAEEAAKEWQYTRLAAEQAKQSSSYRQAHLLYRRAIELAEAHGLGTRAERFDLHHSLAILCREMHNDDEFRQETEKLLALAEGLDPLRRVRALIAHSLQAEEEEESIRAAEEALSIARESGDRRALIEALRWRGTLHFAASEYEAGKRLLRRVIELADAQTRLTAASARQVLAWIVYDEADYDEAERLWQESLDIHREEGDKAGEALVLSNLGTLYATIGETERGIDFLQRSIALSRHIGYLRGEEEAERLLGSILIEHGRFEEGEAHLQRAIDLAAGVDRDYLISYALYGMGTIALERDGDLRRAERLARRSIAAMTTESAEPLGYPWHLLGRVLMAQGNLEEAREALERSLAYRRSIAQTATILDTLADLGLLHLHLGEREAARRDAEEMWAILFPERGRGIILPSACLSCYRIFTALGEPERARRALRLGYEEVQRWAARISREEDRRAYLERRQPHRELIAAWEAEEAG